jgi:nitrite reductase (cytochrome c-552)
VKGGKALDNAKKSLIAIIAVLSVVLFVVCVKFIFVAPTRPAVAVAKIPAGETDPKVWGQAYPLQYASYLKTLETNTKTGFGGSIPEDKDITQPEIKKLFKGMGFGVTYTEDRGHLYALEDIKNTTPKRKAVGACITCKTPDVEKLIKDVGPGYAKMPFEDVFTKVKHPVSCADCHDPETMELRTIRPHLAEALARQGKDINKATKQEMRNYVCAQCHVEYYFAGDAKTVTLPWEKGLTPEAIEQYYDAMPPFKDWEHPDSKAPMRKAQHPEFEMFSSGTHGSAGVSCADCHMPYMKDKNGQKYSSHWMTSPLKHLDSSCNTCHTQGSDWLKGRVEFTQKRTFDLQHTAGTTVARAHDMIKLAAETPGVDATLLDEARKMVVKAQWRWDYVAAENSMGFHNPQLSMSTLGQAIDMANQAIDLARRAAGRDPNEI